MPTDTVQRALDLTVSEPPGEATHWKDHGLVPHRFRTFKLSNDVLELAGKIDFVGLCVDPPAHAIVLSVDEKSQIQALDRTQPGLPMKPGRLVICRDCEMISHPARHLKGWQGILQADAYAGYNRLHDPTREPGPVTLALCWSHARRKFFELADIEGNIRKGKSAKEILPIAFEVVKRIDAVFAIEREINGHDPAARLAVRQSQSAALIEDLARWLRSERALLSKYARVVKAINYLLSSDHWPSFTRFLEGGRICLTNNCAERSLHGVALGRKSWLFAGSERGGQRTAFMYSLIGSAKLNYVDPQAWLADVIARISDLPVSRLPELLPRNWQQLTAQPEKAA